MRVKELVRDLAALPLRHNTLRRQRKALGLSRAALARILEVDPSTVYRQELSNPMSMLWCYALRGIAAEAADKNAKRLVREHKADLARTDQLLGATRLDAEGYKVTAEKMREVARDQAKPKKEPPRARTKPPPASEARGGPAFSKSGIDAVVDRAIARSEANKKQKLQDTG
jgi:transcriptional regulator with XRE-family HTH domain